MLWDRSALGEIQPVQPPEFTGVRNRVYGSNQCCCAGDYLHSVPKHYPARSRLRPHEEFGKKKPCGCEPG